jgi:hypothetical protein
MHLISGRPADLTCRIPGRKPDTGIENSRISGQIEEITVSIQKISKKSLLEAVTDLM